MTDFSISKLLTLPQGQIGLSPVPGTSGDFEADVSMMVLWRPKLVVSLTTDTEMGGLSDQDMAFRLHRNQIDRVHFPIADFGVPDAAGEAAWAELSPKIHAILDQRGRVLAHCNAGRGRSGMIAMRLLVEAGIEPDKAFEAVRAVRAGAVETEAQRQWAERLK